MARPPPRPPLGFVTARCCDRCALLRPCPLLPQALGFFRAAIVNVDSLPYVPNWAAITKHILTRAEQQGKLPAALSAGNAQPATPRQDADMAD